MRQTKDPEIFTFVGNAKFARKSLQLNVANDQVGLARRAISKDGPFHIGNNGLNIGLVEAEDCGAVKRHTIHELNESILNVFERAVLVEMFAVDGSDDSYDRCEQQETAIAFIGFDYEIFAAAETCGSA